jgi:hypothetical protein
MMGVIRGEVVVKCAGVKMSSSVVDYNQTVIRDLSSVKT